MKAPAVLFAFANDRSTPSRYLRELPEEWRAILGAMAQAESAGRCKPVYLPFATAGELFAEFRREEFRGRTAVFHFTGHADSAELLLESTSGNPAAVGGSGLAAFLSVWESIRSSIQ